MPKPRYGYLHIIYLKPEPELTMAQSHSCFRKLWFFYNITRISELDIVR
jgi:hypothetical protein